MEYYFTKTTRIKGEHPILDAYGVLYGMVETHYISNPLLNPARIKQIYNIPSLLMDSIRVEIDALIDSKIECLKLNKMNKEARIKVMIKKKGKRKNRLNNEKQKALPNQQKIDDLRNNIAEDDYKIQTFNNIILEIDKELSKSTPSILFGSKDLFYEQYWCPPEYKNSQEWRQVNYNAWCLYHTKWLYKWRNKRTTNISMIGRTSAPSGNYLLQLQVQENGLITAKIKIPDALLTTKDKYYYITDIDFHANHDDILYLLGHQDVPINHRLIKDEKGWSLHTTYKVVKEPHSTENILSIDVNKDHYTLTLMDKKCGVKKKFFKISFDLRGKSSNQRNNILCENVKIICNIALEYNASIVIEGLDFSKKKQTLGESNLSKGMRQMLNQFPYAKFREAMESRCFRYGVPLFKTNPAYTSFIGSNKFAGSLGITGHMAASYVIGRRHLGFSERLISNEFIGNDGKGTTCVLPARSTHKNEWSYLGEIIGKIKNLRANKRRLLNKVPKILLPKIALSTRASRKIISNGSNNTPGVVAASPLLNVNSIPCAGNTQIISSLVMRNGVIGVVYKV